jgi:hypothetical protein
MSKLPDEAFRDTIGTDDEGNRKFIFLKTWVDFMNIENGLVIFIN